MDQIKSVINYGVAQGTNQQMAKDMWLLSYYCNGMNMKDILNLKFKNIDNDTISFLRQKTSSTNQTAKPIRVALIPQAKEIINHWKQNRNNPDEYVFPILRKNMNKDEKHQVKH